MAKKIKDAGLPASHDDTIVGGDGADVMHGHHGNDSLVAGRGDDKVFGGHGRDYLSGNWGNDRLMGGHDADIFVFDGDFDSDTVMDFDAGEGDSLEFVLYEPAQRAWTGETLLGFCVQEKKDVVLSLPGTDEEVRLRQVDLDDLSANDFDLYFYVEAGDLVA